MLRFTSKNMIHYMAEWSELALDALLTIRMGEVRPQAADWWIAI